MVERVASTLKINQQYTVEMQQHAIFKYNYKVESRMNKSNF